MTSASLLFYLSDIVVSKKKSNLLFRFIVFRRVGGTLFSFQVKKLRSHYLLFLPSHHSTPFEFWFCPHNFTGSGHLKVTCELLITKSFSCPWIHTDQLSHGGVLCFLQHEATYLGSSPITSFLDQMLSHLYIHCIVTLHVCTYAGTPYVFSIEILCTLQNLTSCSPALYLKRFFWFFILPWFVLKLYSCVFSLELFERRTLSWVSL